MVFHCDHHLNQYLFLDVIRTAEDWEGYTSGYNTFTQFAYTFPEITSNQSLTIEKVGHVNLYENDDLIGEYKTNILKMIEDKAEALDSKKEAYKSLGRLGNSDDYSFKYNEYKSTSIIMHGYF